MNKYAKLKPSKDQETAMSSSTSPKPQVKFGVRTNSGRILSLPREEEMNIAHVSEYTSTSSGGPSDYVDYMVTMPPTPDNQPLATDSTDAPGATQSKHGHHRTNSRLSNMGEEAKVPERSLSIMRSANKSTLVRSQTVEFDHNRWLFDSHGTYGYGNAYWQTDGGTYAEMSQADFLNKPWKPLTRKIKIPNGILSPYRLLVWIRLVVLVLFLAWRVRNPNQDAMWLWGMSIVCEIWFAFSWLLDQLPKLNPINRAADLEALREKFETPGPGNPYGRSDLPGMDVFISTADPEKEPPLVTANTLLSILATEYPVEKLSVYISDDGAALLTFEAMAEAVAFAEVWVPFCRKHTIEPRNPEAYFSIRTDPTKNKKNPDFVKDRRWIKREYDEFKVRINGLPELIRKRSNALNKKVAREREEGSVVGSIDNSNPLAKATWMADCTHWPGTWLVPAPEHSKGDHAQGQSQNFFQGCNTCYPLELCGSATDHAGILQVMIKTPQPDPVYGMPDDHQYMDFTGVDIRLPMFVYISREKRKGYDHNKKAGAMNALVRASAILSNGPFIINFDCDHYIYNSYAIREGICYMMDRGGDRICYIQFPQRFEGIDPSDRYANHNTVFFDGNMRALDGLQGPMYVGTGCLFRRYALYGFNPPRAHEYTGLYGQHKRTISTSSTGSLRFTVEDVEQPLAEAPDLDAPKKFGNSRMFVESIQVAEFQGRPLADHPSVKNGRPPGALLRPRSPLDAPTVAEAVSVISCWYEDNSEWGDRIGWIYGSVTEDVVTGYRMHNRGWRSVYCIPKRDAFRGTAPINLTDRLHQVLRWATGSVEIFFSRNNAFLASSRLKFLQRIAYLNVGIYPFTSIFLVVYCTLPALSLFSGYFIVPNLDVTFLVYLLLITVTLMLLSLLEVKWSGIALEELWRNEQFWVIGGSSAHLVAVLQGLLKVVAGIEISFTLTSKSAAEDEDDIYADLYVIKYTSLFIPPLMIITVNIAAIFVGCSRTIYSEMPQWGKLFGGVFFSFWVLSHMYPFAKGLMGRRGRTPTIIYVWVGLLAITLSLLWITISPPDADGNGSITI